MEDSVKSVPTSARRESAMARTFALARKRMKRTADLACEHHQLCPYLATSSATPSTSTRVHRNPLHGERSWHAAAALKWRRPQKSERHLIIISAITGCGRWIIQLSTRWPNGLGPLTSLLNATHSHLKHMGGWPDLGVLWRRATPTAR